ncbi:MAG: transcriptional regulator [Paenibacillaceae bacterium]|nr:transcriptional regulator [Paenibacillaceae bacterium]
MELRHLHTFIAVVEAGSFTKAAAALGYVQSSVTAQIQALEAELGTPLFDRLGKKTTLTAAGQKFLPYAQEISKLHALAKDAIRFNEEISGTLVLSAPESLTAFRLPAVIREFKSRYPAVQIILKPGVCWEMTERIKSGEMDLVFMLQLPTEDKDLHIEPLVEERMTLIAPPGHPLEKADPVTPGDLKEEVMLYTEPGCTYRALFEHSLNACGVYPSQGLEFWSIEAIKNCVISGLGLSFLPLITVENEIRQGRLAALAWDDRPQRLVTQMASHKRKAVTPVMREFMCLVRQHAVKWREDTEQTGN